MENALVLKTKLDTKSFDKEIAYLKDEAEDLNLILKDAGNIDEADARKYEKRLEQINNRLNTLYQKQNEINSQGFKKVQSTLENVNKSASNVGKSIVRWGLTLLGVRSAMTLIRGSMSTLSQYDEQLAKNMEYIRYVIAMALKPLIEYIIDLVFKLLQYVNYISVAWFNTNLFANASAKSMEKTNKSIKNASKSMKELNKDMLGFDKINKLTSQKSASSGAGTKLPSTDLSKILGDQDVPEWLRWIKDNGETIISILAGIVGGLTAVKLGLGLISGLGIFTIITGVVDLIQRVPKYLENVDTKLKNNGNSWKDFGAIIQDIGLIILGIGIITGNVYVIIAGIIVLLIGLIASLYDEINKKVGQIKTIIDIAIKSIRKDTGVLFDGVVEVVRTAYSIISGIFKGFFNPLKNSFDTFMLLLKGKYKDAVVLAVKSIVNSAINTINVLIEGVNLIALPIRGLILALSKIQGKNVHLDEIRIPKLPLVKMATGGIINYPGRGVPIGMNAVVGERGAEGVIPLTDNSAMERLGESIGRHVKVNLDLTTEIEGRVLARVLKQINSEDNFARNGG